METIFNQKRTYNITGGGRMIFRDFHIYPMWKGCKRYTRRFWKTAHVKIGNWYPVTHKMFYAPEDIVGEIYVEDIYRRSLGTMTENDAFLEGGYKLCEYQKTLEEITKKPWDAFAVPYVVKFRFVPADVLDPNGGQRDYNEYKRLYKQHMQEIKEKCRLDFAIAK